MMKQQTKPTLQFSFIPDMETQILSYPLLPILILCFCILLMAYKFIVQSFLESFELQIFSQLQFSSPSPIWRSAREIPDLISAEFIEELRLDHFKFRWEASNRVDCMVCLLEFEDGEEITVLKCKHLFHRSCLDKWLVYRQFTCPLCRSCLLPEKMTSKQQELQDQHDNRLVFRVPSFHGSSIDATWWFG